VPGSGPNLAVIKYSVARPYKKDTTIMVQPGDHELLVNNNYRTCAVTVNSSNYSKIAVIILIFWNSLYFISNQGRARDGGKF
jgi:hypothetical protein